MGAVFFILMMLEQPSWKEVVRSYHGIVIQHEHGLEISLTNHPISRERTLVNHPITDEMFEYLIASVAAHPGHGVDRLYLAKFKVTPRLLTAIKSLGTVRSLQLNSVEAPFDHDQMSQIATIQNLGRLAIFNSSFAAGALTDLHFDSLQKLELADCRLTASDLRGFMDAAPNVTTLRFGQSTFGPGFFDALVTYQRVESLDFCETEIGDAEIRKVSQLSQLRYLNTGPAKLTPDTFDALAACPSLVELDTWAISDRIRNLKRLKALGLSLEELTDAEIDAIVSLPKLEKLCVYNERNERLPAMTASKLLKSAIVSDLSLSGFHVDRDVIEAYLASPTLKTLRFSLCDFNTDAVCAQSNSSLRSLEFFHCKLDLRTLEHLGNLRGIRMLTIVSSGGWPAGGLTAVRDCASRLEELHLRFDNVRPGSDFAKEVAEIRAGRRRSNH